MTPLTFTFLGIVGLVFTLQTIRTPDEQLAIISGIIGTITWPLWGFSALQVTTHSGGSEFVLSHPSLAAFGLLLAVPNLYIALTGPLALAKDPRELAQEVK